MAPERGGAGGNAPSIKNGGQHMYFPPPTIKDTIRDIKKIINWNFMSNFSIVLEISRLFDNFELFLKNYDLKYSIFLTFLNFEKKIRKNYDLF